MGRPAEMIRDRGCMALLGILGLLGSIPETEIMDHYERNCIIWEKYKEKYLRTGFCIENQDIMRRHEGMDFIYGRDSAWCDRLNAFGINRQKMPEDRSLQGYFNTCEIIAVYNAEVYLSEGIPQRGFPDLISGFERHGAVLGGYFGTSPYAVKGYLKRAGYRTLMVSGRRLYAERLTDISSGFRVFIMTAYNISGRISSGIHTMCITAEDDGTYCRHNDPAGAVHGYGTLSEAVYSYNSGRCAPVCVIAAGTCSRRDDPRSSERDGGQE